MIATGVWEAWAAAEGRTIVEGQCRLLLDDAVLGPGPVSMEDRAGSYGQMAFQEVTDELAAGAHTLQLQCRVRDAGAETRFGNVVMSTIPPRVE